MSTNTFPMTASGCAAPRIHPPQIKTPGAQYSEREFPEYGGIRDAGPLDMDAFWIAPEGDIPADRAPGPIVTWSILVVFDATTQWCALFDLG
jgi:hypothetical protein